MSPGASWSRLSRRRGVRAGLGERPLTLGSLVNPGSIRWPRQYPLAAGARLTREPSPDPGSTHRPRVHRRLPGAPPTPGTPASSGSTAGAQSAPSDGAGRSLSPAIRGVAERGRCLFSPGSPPPLPEPRHRRIAKVASLSGALPFPFLPLRVGAHLPTPSARQLSGHPCGSLSSSSRFSAALGRGGGGRDPGEASAAYSTESGRGGGL